MYTMTDLPGSAPLPDTARAVHAARRARLARAIGDGVAVIPTAPERVRNRDSHYPYRYDSYFYYLTGFSEPEATLVVTGGTTPQSWLFCRDRHPEREIWDGVRWGPARARAEFGVDAAFPTEALDTQMESLLENRGALWYPVGTNPAWDTRAMGWLNAVRAKARTVVAAPAQLQHVCAVLDEMRLVKDAHETALMRRAGTISAEAHRRAMRATRPGRFEYEIEAELLYEFRRQGAQFPAYWPIVAGGTNACILHYRDNDARLRENTLLLIDAGCELNGYAADITRTFPVSGKFTGAQREAYEIVLASQAAAIAAVRPGALWNDPHDAAVKVLAQGMLDLRLLTGSLDAVLEQETYKRFYMHRTGHWLGLDVHDAGDYKVSGAWRALAPGMTLTVEPGLYVRAAADVPEALHDLGIRIEDDVQVNAAGCEVLTVDAPKSVADIEALMRDAA